MLVVETNIDDMNPELYGWVLERLFAAGAVDAWCTPISMKKNRPAVMLQAICPPHVEAAVVQTMLRETTTLGVRIHAISRRSLPRSVTSVATPLGSVRVKSIGAEGGRQTLEYDDVLRIARDSKRPIAEVSAALERFLSGQKAT